MAASSLVSQNKRGTDEYWNCGFSLPQAKRTNTHDSVIMALLEKIDNMDAINSNPEEIKLQDERLNGVIEDKIRLNGQADDVGEKGISEKGSIQEGEITEVNSEATSDSDTADMHFAGTWTYYDDVRAESGIFIDHTAFELGIIINLLDGNSKADIMFSESNTETVYASLWEDDIWQWNEHSVIQNVFASTQQEESGFSGVKFHDVWNDFRPIQRLSASVEEGLWRTDREEKLPLL